MHCDNHPTTPHTPKYHFVLCVDPDLASQFIDESSDRQDYNSFFISMTASSLIPPSHITSYLQPNPTPQLLLQILN